MEERRRRKGAGAEMEKAIVKLSEAEWKVMDVLWEEAPKTIMQLTRRFQETTGWTKHTVMTFLKRMEEKGAIYHEEGERAKLYFPKIDRQEAAFPGDGGIFGEGFWRTDGADAKYHGGAKGFVGRRDLGTLRDPAPCGGGPER